MKVFVLFYDHDGGDREEWNTFYTPCEVFSSVEKREARKVELTRKNDEDEEPPLLFHEIETEMDNPDA